MKRSEIKILIVEDDQHLGKALQEGLSRAGYSPRWTQSPDQALSLFKVSDFKLVIMDCMLPKISGVQLATDLRNLSVNEFKLIFTSGIFKDKSFSQSAISQAQADAFLIKPFDLNALLAQVEQCISSEVEEEKAPLTELMSKASHALTDVKKALEKQSSYHGFDLPWIYSLLHRAEFSGRLNVIPVGHPPFSLSFSKGNINNVQMSDNESYFGVLLVEMGFTSIDEVEESLKAQGGKPIGQLLIDANALSPHAVQVVLTEQLAIRVSKSIQDTPVEISLSPETVAENQASLGAYELSLATHDWISSKISSEWLSNFYMQWLEHPVNLTSNVKLINERKHLPLMAETATLLARIDGKMTLQNLIDLNPENESLFLQSLHFGVLEGLFYFGTKTSGTLDFSSLKKRLENFAKGIDDKNYFEWLGLTSSATVKEISKAYLEMAKNFHPDKLSPQAPRELRDLSQKIFAKVSEAHEILKDEEKRRAYKKELEQGSAADNLRAEVQFEQALGMINRGQYKDAETLLENMKKFKVFVGQIKIHLIWAKIKANPTKALSSVQLNEVKNLLVQVPPEDRHCAAFFYVKGLYSKAVGDNKKAYTFFRNAIATNPNMAEAKRDLSLLVKEVQSQQRASGDWSNFMAKMFKSK